MRGPDLHPESNGQRRTGSHQAEVHPLRDFGSIECSADVSLVIFRFVSYGRLAHFRRSLQALPHVTAVRIASYSDQTAQFALTVNPGTSSGSLQLPGTRLLSSDGRRVELCVESW